MKTPEIPISQIEMGERFRKEYGDIDQLAFDIKKNGLITPIAIGVSKNVQMDVETDLPYVLLAGGRRFTAVKALGWDAVPVRIYSQPLNELELRSIELAENFCRKDLTYAEDVALKRKINLLQVAIHGEKVTKSPEAPGWSQADTAKLIGKSAATVTKDIQLADAIERFPELQLDQCKNKNEAMKRLKNVGKILHNKQKASEYEACNNSGTFDKLSTCYIIADFFDIVKKVPDNTINIMEIDPPYGIDLHKVKKDNECIGYNEINASEYEDFLKRTLTEAYRVCREGGWLIFWFAADPWFQTVASCIQKVGFKMNMIPGIWVKPQGQTAQPETFLGNSYEMFFYARKGKSKLSKPGRSNIFQFNPVPHTQKYHPTQRPLDLMTELLMTFGNPGDQVMVPFLGSGVTLLASHLCQMKAFGTDLTQEFKDGYVVKLKEELG